MLRIGQGFDVHALIAGRPLILGGVQIPHKKGLEGHSDADVLLHAICDAMLGAMGLGDIGRHFPDTDDRWKGANSRELLRLVRDMLTERGAALVNIDATILAQQPRLAPWMDAMHANLAADLQVDESCINIKATTTEHLGMVGREEGIAAQAIALVELPRKQRVST